MYSIWNTYDFRCKDMKEEEIKKEIEKRKILAVPLSYLENYVVKAVKENKYQDEMLFIGEVKKIVEQSFQEGQLSSLKNEIKFLKRMKDWDSWNLMLECARIVIERRIEELKTLLLEVRKR